MEKTESIMRLVANNKVLTGGNSKLASVKR